MTFLKDDSALLTIDLVAEQRVDAGRRAPEQVTAAAHVYNRLGGLLTRLCGEHGIDIASVVAIWLAQTGGRIFDTGARPTPLRSREILRGVGTLQPAAVR